MAVSEKLVREVNLAEQKRVLKELEVYGYSSIKNYLTPETTNKLLSLTNEYYLNTNRA